MKYLTKEWLNTELLSYTYSQIKISKKTEKYDEGYYQKLYKKICKLYIAAERGEELYQDPQEELRKIEESIAEPKSIYKKVLKGKYYKNYRRRKIIEKTTKNPNSTETTVRYIVKPTTSGIIPTFCLSIIPVNSAPI